MAILRDSWIEKTTFGRPRRTEGQEWITKEGSVDPPKPNQRHAREDDDFNKNQRGIGERPGRTQSPRPSNNLSRKTIIYWRIQNIPRTGRGSHETIRRWLSKCKNEGQIEDVSSRPRSQYSLLFRRRRQCWRTAPTFYLSITCIFFLLSILYKILNVYKNFNEVRLSLQA